MNIRNLYFVLSLFISASVGAMANAKPLTYEDIFSFEEVSDPQFSLDGKHIVYTRIFADIMTDSKYSNLWMVSFDGKNHRPLTRGNFNDSRPRWSPDGRKILFASNRQGSVQLYTIVPETKKIVQLSEMPTTPSGHAWSPDGKYINYSAFVPDKASEWINLPSPPDGAKWSKPPVFIDKLHYRFNGQYLQNGQDHLFVLSAAGGTPRQVTPRGRHYSLSPHLTTTPSWSKDSQSLIFSANLSQDYEHQPLESDLYQIEIGSGAITPLTQREGPQHSPLVSPDGNYIAYLGYEGKQYRLVTKLYVMKRDGSQSRVLTGDLDRSVSQLQWSAGSQGLFFLYADQGNTQLGYQSLQGEHNIITQDIGSSLLAYPSGSYSISKRGHFVVTHSRPDRIGELMTGSLKDKNRGKKNKKLLVSVNADIFDHRTLGKVEEMRYNSTVDSLGIQSWIIKPPNFDPKKKYPLIVNIHGGPMSHFGDRFSLMMQVMAAQGYVVLYVNPRGSTSYGENFGEIIHQHTFPGKDFHDIESGVDTLLQRGYIDKNNLFVTGISYGATMTCWIIGNTDRYRAAVPLAPVTNWYSATLTTEAPVQYKQLSGDSFPWEDHDSYFKRSPLSLVGQVKTPTLLITGEDDYRNPISESEAYFTALKLQKVDAAMIRLPDEDHAFYRRPSNTYRAISSMMSWFEQYRKGAAQ